MGYVVFHMQKTRGTDSGISAHIERKIKPSNADEKRTHLTRRLVEYPDGAQNRTQAIQYRLRCGVGRNSKNYDKAFANPCVDNMTIRD